MPAIPVDSNGNPLYPDNNTQKPIVNASSSAKDNSKNSDVNDPKRVLSKPNSQYIEISPYHESDVSAYIYFRMFSYERRRQSERIENGVTVSRSTGTSGVTGASDKTEYKGSIVLPLTQPINMGYQINWDSFDSPLSAKGALDAGLKAAQAAAQTALSLGGVVANGMTRAIGSAAEAAEPLTEYITNVAANEAETVANLDSELVLQGIGLRKHTFEFLLTPRNAKETEMIMKAIKEFKKASSPARSNGGLTLEYPYEFAIYFMDGRKGREGEALKIPTIPDCACININVTYNPQLVRFNEDKTPIQYRLSLQFVEHQTLTRDDIEEGGF